MKKFRFREPYKANGRTAYPETRQASGVYIIKEDDLMVYIGYSSKNLYKTLYRHFEHWHHSGQPVVTYKTRLSRHKYTVRVVFCTALQADKLERALILSYRPRDNENKYEQYQLKFDDKKLLKQYDETKVIQTDEEPF